MEIKMILHTKFIGMMWTIKIINRLQYNSLVESSIKSYLDDIKDYSVTKSDSHNILEIPVRFSDSFFDAYKIIKKKIDKSKIEFLILLFANSVTLSDKMIKEGMMQKLLTGEIRLN